MPRHSVAWAYIVVSMTLATVTLFALPGYADAVRGDLGLSSAQVGLLTTAMALPYALVQVPGGLLASVFGIGRVFGLAFALVAIGFFGSALTSSLAVLVAVRVVAGIGAGMLLPLGSSLARTIAAEQNLRAQGVLGSGWGMGYLTALFALPLLFDGWRTAFAAIAAAALVLAVVAPVAVEPGRLAAARTVAAEAATALRLRRVWLCGVCLLGMTFVNVGLGAWVNAFLKADESVPSQAVRWLPALVGIGLLPASAIGAAAASGGRERRVVLTSAAGLAVVAALLAVARPLPLIALLLFGLGWFSAFPFGVILASVVAAGGAARAETQGILAGAVNGLGFIAGSAAPPLVGAVKDATGGYELAFLVLVVGAVVSFAAATRAFAPSTAPAAIAQHG